MVGTEIDDGFMSADEIIAIARGYDTSRTVDAAGTAAPPFPTSSSERMPSSKASRS
jgi:hypothetical protein